MEPIEPITLPLLMRPIESLQWMNQPCGFQEFMMILGITICGVGLFAGIIYWRIR